MISVQKHVFKSWLTVMAGSLLFFYSFIQLKILDAIFPALTHEFHLTLVQHSHLISVYFYANLIFLLPAVFLVDRFSARFLLLCGLCLSIISLLILYSSKTLAFIELSRVLSGIAGAFSFITVVRLASRFFTEKQWGVVIGFIMMMSMLGGMLVHIAHMYFGNIFGWRNFVLAFVGLGILFCILVLLLVKNCPSEEAQNNLMDIKTAHQLGLWRSFYLIAKRPYNWLCGFYTALMNLPIYMITAFWGVLYLVRAEHLSHTAAPFVTGMLYLGALVGLPLVGFLSDYFERRTFFMFLGALFSLLLIVIILVVPVWHYFSLLLLFFLLGFFTSSQFLSYPLVMALNPRALTATAAGIVSFILMASGFIFQPLFDFILTHHWTRIINLKVDFYTVHDFKWALFILPIGFAVSMLLAFLLKGFETKLPKKEMMS